MPADRPDINLCKAIMSGVAVGYPLPTLLNWDGDFNRPDWHFGGSHIAKLESLLSVIEELLSHAEDAHDDDLALMIDAYDIWFQLPPAVLIERFHQLNREADERNQKAWHDLINATDADPADFPIPPPKQSIIVTTAKDCFPTSSSGSDPHYEHWPESPMPGDMYGEGTDELTPPLYDSARKYKKVRPRCVNSGMIMGTMGSLKAALQRCKEKVDRVAKDGRQLWSDQALFGEVIGDQEGWRDWVRGLAETWNGTAAQIRPGRMDRHVANIAGQALQGRRFEFGIGLDYNFTTIPATCSAEEDGEFVRISNATDLELMSRAAGVPDGNRVKGTPPELADAPGDGPLEGVDWGEEPLYTDFFFGVTPAGIHHNAYIANLKPYRLKEWWGRMWFYPRLRELVTRHLEAGAQSTRLLLNYTRTDAAGVAYRADKGSKVTVYNPVRGQHLAHYDEISWDGVCQKGSKPWHAALFGDDKGPLEAS